MKNLTFDISKIFPSPDVLLSRDKGSSKNPGTNSSVQGQNQFSKRTQKTVKDVLKQEIIEKNSDCPVSSCVRTGF